MQVKLIIAGIVASCSIALAQTVVTSQGTITEYSPGQTFIVKEASGPVTYHYSPGVQYYRGGKVMTTEEVRTIKTGTPVNVQYSTKGEDRFINRMEFDLDIYV